MLLMEYQQNKDLYQQVHEASLKSPIVRVTGPGIGLSAALASLCFRVGAVVETLFKGFANLFKGNFELGGKQLTLGLGFHAVNLALLAIEGPVNIFLATFGMLIKPTEFSFNQFKKMEELQANNLGRLQWILV